jgi:hypothetical protein
VYEAARATPSILTSTAQEDVSFQYHAPGELEKHWTTPNNRTASNKFWSLYMSRESILLRRLCSKALTKSVHRRRQLDTKELYNGAYCPSQVPCQALKCTMLNLNSEVQLKLHHVSLTSLFQILKGWRAYHILLLEFANLSPNLDDPHLQRW